MFVWAAGFCFFLSAADAATNIPSQAWSRDINAGGYTDGAPIGGFGAGTMTWDFSGNFYLGRLNIATAAVTTGNAPYAIDANAHFYMYQKLSGQAAVEKMLNAATLGSGEATYYSLFPKAWVDYSGPTFPLETKVTQFSPIIPGDYQRTSYPEGIYEWDVTNSQAVSCDFAVMLTFDNTFGGTNAAVTTSGSNVGLVLTRNTGNASSPAQGEFSLASQTSTGVTVTYESAAALTTLQTAFAASGNLADTTGNNTIGAIAFKVTLAPGQSVKIPIVLAWDIPQAKPGTGAAWYREYTKYYGGVATGRTGFNSGAIAFDALNNYATWEASIDSWQSGILTGNYPDWLKQMLFNELYYYFTGGTMWEAGQVGSTAFDAKPSMFSSLESYIYDFYGTSDVRFYGSWPLALLWPNIDKQEVQQFCDSVTTGTSLIGVAPLSAATCAHDIGDDNGVFTEWNAYVYRDSTTWKDLNSKLVLMVYRAWELTGKTDTTFLNYCWPAVQAAMTKVHGECDANGLPYSNGIDQTYDDMGLYGDTAYCGSLFLAACEAAQSIATAEGNSALATTYGTWLTTGQTGFNTLWNGTYYNIDNGATDTAQNRIMVDQLAGEWYAKALGLPGIVSDANANSAWQVIHDNNWKKFDGGAHGAVNVMTAAGAIDTTWPQSQEAWVGVSWGAAAGMIQQGMFTQGTDLGYSLYNSIWNLGQFWFRTPEAWETGLANFRAPYYMRANAIWAVKHAYDIAPPPCGLLTCTATPTFSPTLTQTPTATVNPCAYIYEAVDCGSAAQTIIGGVTWLADKAYTASGYGYVTVGTTATTATAITGSGAQQPIYQSERYAPTLEYKFTVPNGTYQVTIKNAEQYWTAPGKRVFNVAINGVTVLNNLDIFSQVGEFAADDHTFTVSVTGGLIDLVEAASADNAELTGVEIVSEAPCSPTPSPTQTFTPSPTVTPTPTWTVTKTMTMTPTVSPTASASATASATASASATSTPTLTATVSATATITQTPQFSPTATATSTLTATLTATVSATGTPSITATSAFSPTATVSPTRTMTASATGTPSLTATPTTTPSFTKTVTLTVTPSATKTPTLIPTASPTGTMAASATPTALATATPSPTLTMTPIPTQTASATASPTPLPTNSPTGTLTATPIPTMSFTDISAPYPNPTSGGPVTIQLNLSGSYQVKWDIFTTAFRRIAGQSSNSLPGNTLIWNLKDPEGQEAANGIYYWRVELKDAGGSHTRLVKILVLR